MKSWAVPKGPSLDPRDKRMAVAVEDHPLAYAAFEGEIPSGQYGAGRVIIWDKGSWQPVGDAERGYAEGNLKFALRGHKLNGHWALVRMKGKPADSKNRTQDAWLLIKEKDEFARPAAEFSVLDEMPGSVRGLPVLADEPLRPSGAASMDAAQLPAGSQPAPLPAVLQPELATLVSQAPSNAADWLFEIKFDGYRLLARVEGKQAGQQVQLITRNGHDWTSKMPPLQQALQALALPDGWYDGELVVMDERGLPNFQALQQSLDNPRSANLLYFLFDMPFCKGHDLRQVPLQARRAYLQALLAERPGGGRSGAVRFSQEFEASGGEVVASACHLGLEGVIGKRRDAPYEHKRSPNWIKLKCGQRQEFVVGGYTDPQGTRIGLGALLLGVHEGGQLRYAGSVGTGFDDRSLRELQAQLAQLVTEQSPFAASRDLPRGAHWVRPVLVAEVSFGEWTQTGRVRHPVFQGLRSDKPASTIVREAAQSQPVAKPKQSPAMAARSPEPSVHSNLPTGWRMTHPERVIDAASGSTKLHLVRYYALVADLMLPHLKGRPLALVRAPDGVGGELFFQKHTDTRKLPGIEQMDPALYPGHAPMLEIASTQGLLSAAQWNVLEIHTQNAVGRAYDKPDRLVFDLDPGEGLAWAQMQEAASLVKALLDELGLCSFLKTSGGKGLHVVVPIKRLQGWDAAKDFSQAVVAHLAKTLPQRFVLKSGPSNRVGKIFADYLRNGVGATTVAAWSPRARPGLGISVPVDWDELSSLRGGDHWRVQTVHERLDRGNDPWQAYGESARSLSAAAKTLGHTLKR